MAQRFEEVMTIPRDFLQDANPMADIESSVCLTCATSK